MTDPKQQLRAYTTVGLIALGLALIVTGAVVIWTDEITKLDFRFGEPIRDWVNGIAWLKSGAITLGRMTETIPMAIACIVAEIILLIRGHYRATLYMVVAMTSMGVLMYTLKPLVDRERPGYELYEMTDMAFPSGHALTAMTISTIIVILSTHLLRNGMPRWVPYVLAVYVLIICADRIFVGVHHITDVVAGGLYGLAFGTLAAVIVNVTKCKPRGASKPVDAPA